MATRVRTLDPRNHREVALLARVHEGVPRAWDPAHRPDELRVADTIVRLAASARGGALVLVAEDEAGDLVGFHWLEIQRRDGEQVGSIFSLWVREDYRGRGTALALKQQGEAWARAHGATSMRTLVHFDNERMLRWNARNGFEPGFVEMVKKL